jgi:dolichyl-phosphate-mannose--protein O-mannosyl transferase
MTTTTTPYGPFEKLTMNPFEHTVKYEAIADEHVRCGDTVRLEHVLTKRNLHSESLFMSMITEAQEVSAFGSDGLGDESN